MSGSISKGYDATPQREEDDLDRWRFASNIVDAVIATPPDWSARIGIFGKWGEGKSTVLRFAEQMLKEKENVVFMFNPWAIRNWNDLWEDFGSRLYEALTAANIQLDSSWKQLAKKSGRWLESKGVGRVGQVAAQFWGKETIYNAAFDLLGRWLKYDGAQIRMIREKLRDRRIVVLIDDLDRCTPELIPQLLLSLRELLDLPGFTFMLSFDDEIVAQALAVQNPAWGNGINFLDKILDFRFHLPAVTEQQKLRFTRRMMEKYCPFVPPESTEEIRDLLPSNPRKLKVLIRSLTALRPQIDRHAPDELNWVDMWLAQMLRLESYTFFARLLRDDTLDKEVGVSYRFTKSLSQHDQAGKSGPKNDSLQTLIKESGVDEPVLVQRLVQLLEAARSRSSYRFRYMCELAERPQAVTWKEFRSLLDAWSSDRKPTILSQWVAEHATNLAVGMEDVEQELFEAMVQRRAEVLSAAAESTSLREHDSSLAEAGTLLEMLGQFLLDLGKLGAPQFQKVYDQASRWIGFRKNPSDNRQRNDEESLLLRLLSAASPMLSMELFEIVGHRSWDIDMGDSTPGVKQALREKCMAIVAPATAKVAIEFLTRADAIQSLTEEGRYSSIKYCLFDPSSPVWKPALRDELMELVRKGQNDHVIYTNVRAYFDLLVRGLESGIDPIGREDIAALISDEAFVRSIWDTVTSRGIQYRMQISIIRSRQVLIRHGVPATALPLNEELRRRAEEEPPARAASSTTDHKNVPPAAVPENDPPPKF